MRAGLLEALAGIDLGQPRQGAQQRRLAAAIAAHQAGAVASGKRHGDTRERRPPAKGDAGVAQGKEGRGGHAVGADDES
jgi:hypothetical protein